MSGLPLEVIDLDTGAGRALREALDLRSVPAVVIDGKLRAIGVQSREEIDALLNAGCSGESQA